MAILFNRTLKELYRFDGFLDRIHIAESKPVKYGQGFKHVDRSIITKPGQYNKDDYKTLVLENIEYRLQKLQWILFGEDG